jgi:hypothetical protein
MEFKKYGMGAEMSPMEALRLAQESRAFAAQGVEMSKDMRQGMAKYGMSDTQILQPGGEPGGEPKTIELPEATVFAPKGRKRGM